MQGHRVARQRLNINTFLITGCFLFLGSFTFLNQHVSAQVPRFIRGDANVDGKRNLGDAVYSLFALFGDQVEPTCIDALDFDDSGEFDLTDPIASLTWQFLGGSPPPAPHTECGIDPTEDELGCEEYSLCPVNEDPSVVLTADPTFGEAPLEVQFDASNAEDTDGEIVSFTWDFGDGSDPQELEAQTSYSYEAAGDYTVTVTVTDNEGGTATDDVLIRVDPPVSRPQVTQLLIEEELVRGEIATLSFDWEDDEEDIAIVRFGLEDELQTQNEEVSAKLFGIEGMSGSTQFEIPTSEFPFGIVTIRVQLVDAVGNEGNTAEATLNIIAGNAGGNAPTISQFDASIPQQNRPTNPHSLVKVPLNLTYEDLDGDAAWMRVGIQQPGEDLIVNEFSLEAFNLPGDNATLERNFFEFSSESTLGTYNFELTIIDQNANVSTTETTSVELVESGGSIVVDITSFNPPTGGAGTLVTIEGIGFDADNLEQNVIELNSTILPIQSITEDTIEVEIPAGSETGAFIISNRNGRAVAPTQFVVPPSITLSPETTKVSIENTIEFDALVIPIAGSTLEWSVDGIVGGNATVGTIDQNGVYTAPDDIPNPPTVDVSAVLVGDEAIIGSATVEICPPASYPGEAEILRSVGGRVISEDGFATIIIPPLALPETTVITIETHPISLLPPAPDDERIFSSIEFGPDGLVFDAPVTIVMPLTNYLPPGTELTLAYFDEGDDEWVEEGVAIVNENGNRAVATITHFSNWISFMDQTEPDLPAPVISSIESPLETDDLVNPGYEEGRKVPFRITGLRLTPDLIATVVDENGDEDTRFSVGTLYTLNNNAGVAVQIPVLEDLDPDPLGGLVRYLRLTRPNGEFDEESFTVLGLPELFVPENSTINLFGDLRYSRVIIDGTVVVPNREELNIEVTNYIEVSGRIDAEGVPGADAHLTTGAPNNSEGGHGSGGDGRRDNGCFHDIFSIFCDDWDESEPENFGNHGNYCKGFPADFPRQRQSCDPLTGSGRTEPEGLGGWPGFNFGIDVGDLLDLALCVDGDIEACISFGLEVATIVDGISNLATERFIGGRGFGAVRTFQPGPNDDISSDGGGGGGGSRFSIDAVVAACRLYGGGGGAGGSGGRPVRILTPGNATITGSISTMGGDGGDGSTDGILQFDVFFSFATIGDEVPFIPAAPGGGGGGGRGGDLMLQASTGLENPNPNSLRAHGGESGEGGVTFVDPVNGNWSTSFQFNPASNGPIGLYRVRGPILDPTEIGFMVTNRLLLNVTPIRSGGASITPENQSTVNYDFTGGVSKQIQLGQGFNRVVDPTTIEFLVKQVLVLAPDRDGDGLSDDDETQLTNTDPDNPDTDGDGLNDGHEVAVGTEPLNPDTDQDGIPDGPELTGLGLSPLHEDSDGDNHSDGAEIILGTNPLLSGSFPTELPNGTILVQSGRSLYVLDEANARTGKLGDLPGLTLGFGHAFDNAGQYFMSPQIPAELVEADPFTAALGTTRGPLETAGNETRLTYQLSYHPGEGVFFGSWSLFAPTNQLLTIDPATGLVTDLGALQSGPIHGVLVFKDQRLLVAIKKDDTTDTLVELDPTDGSEIQVIGDIGFPGIFGLLEKSDGTLLGLSTTLPNQNETKMVNIDPDTGVGTLTDIILGRRYFSLARKEQVGGGCGPLSFGGHHDAGSFLAGLGLGDSDNDGKADVFACRHVNSAVISYTDFDGTDFTVGNIVASEPHDAVVARFDNTSAAGGKDIAIAATGADEINIKFFDGGTLDISHVDDGSPTTLKTGDFNDDGNLDLLARSEDSISIYHGDGAGGFTHAYVLTEYNEGVTVGDFNGDGRDDFAYIAWDLVTYLSNAGGGFTQDQYLSVDAGFYSVSTGDINGDGITDITGTGLERLRYYVYIGNGDGSFPPEYYIDAPGDHYPYRHAVGDITGDGYDDIISLDQNEPRFAIMKGDAAGTLTALDPFYYETEAYPVAVKLDDVDGDGSLDIAVASDQGEAITIWLNSCP